ncbi:GDP-mannose 4,6-dehydratase [Paenibacillus sp. BSR1-1]|uniref:GDP-mannose 4,6-dehydratase n=1 Tax=Paenibacillus sp. BSR1-1 TaxID=3020845 RepID=UPI0025AFF51F|nr:NAD-dependent epimerase/dehydratase family protein [Paenibacillus sp. BSR1-1]MDN3017493.1 GDP-mannose 4,6-dehydratase [Paenibacillus sp. BSR1-1]
MQKLTGGVFVTGCAGFIGFHLSKRLLDEGFHVLGIDNINNYYDTTLKYDRLSILANYPNFSFIKGSIENLELLESIFDQYNIDIVVNLAAQAGVRYSLKNPHVYIQSNLVGFANILDCCKKYQIKHLIYASSSSVYGNNKKIPFSVNDRVDNPVSLYGATKKANEVLAYSYSQLYQLPVTGLRFFTVYGPWGRPDMAYYTFSNAIMNQEPIEVYNYGNMKRDFTYIDDVIESIYRLIKKGPPDKSNSYYKIYNIGNHHPVNLNDFIQVLEEHLGKNADMRLLPFQPGDVQETYADIDDLVKDINYKPVTSVKEGIRKFVEWYKEYNKIS